METTERVMIVDDNKTIQRSLQETLRGLYELKVVSSGEEALEKADAFKPNIILLDIMMGEVDGYEVCERIRKKDKSHDIRIIFLTAKTSLDDKLRGYKVGGDDYLTKPFEASELLAKLMVFSKLKHKKNDNQSTHLSEDDKHLGICYEIKRKLRSITYIKAASPYCNVYYTQEKGDFFRVRISIKTLADFFEESSLVRVHRSYLVNSKFITTVLRQNNHEEQILIFENRNNPIVIPIGQSYQSLLCQKLPSIFSQ